MNNYSIAKLGQPILPLNGATVAEDSDHEQVPSYFIYCLYILYFPLISYVNVTQVMQSSPEPEPQKQRSKPGKAPRPVPTPRIVAQPDRSDFSSTFTSMLVPSHQPSPMMSGQQPYPLMQFLPPSFTGTMGSNSQHFDTLMSENRMHNSEVRMHLCRLTDKIDLLLQKVTKCLPYLYSITDSVCLVEVDWWFGILSKRSIQTFGGTTFRCTGDWFAKASGSIR